MRSYAVLTVMVAATLVFGGADGRSFTFTAVTDNEVEAGERECPHMTSDTTPVLSVMQAKMFACYMPSNVFKAQLKNATDASNTDANRLIYARACLQEPAVRACVAALDADADVCIGDATELKMWTIASDFVKTGITAVCGDGGEVWATMFDDELEAMSEVNQLRIKSCFDDGLNHSLLARAESETDPPSFFLRKYNLMVEVRNCIVNVAKNGGTSARQFERFMDQIFVSMKCLSPTTNDIVLCSTLQPADPTA